MNRRRSRHAPRKTVFGRIVAFVFGLALALVVAEIAMRILTPHWRDFDARRFMTTEFIAGYGLLPLGRPGFSGYFAQNNGDFRSRIDINAFGLRNDEPVQAADGRVWFVGDSMTFGWGVDRDKIYAAVAARESGMASYLVASPGTAVCGYQALVARMPKSVHPKAVVVGLVLENDLSADACRHEVKVESLPVDPGDPMLLGIKHWMTRNLALYNAITETSKRVPALVDALQWTGLIAREHAYQVNFTAKEMGAVVAATADELVRLRAMLSADTPFAVVIVPGRFELRDKDPFYIEVRKRMDEALQQRGIDSIDPADAMAQAGFAKVHFAHDGHWSVEGHHIAGMAVADWLRRHKG